MYQIPWLKAKKSTKKLKGKGKGRKKIKGRNRMGNSKRYSVLPSEKNSFNKNSNLLRSLNPKRD